MQAEAIVTIANKRGLHARAAAKFVKTASSFNARVIVAKPAASGESQTKTAEGSEILELLMLGADIGSSLHISAQGEQAQQAVRAIQTLVNAKFGEDE